MANCISYCDEGLLPHELVNCNDFALGGGTEMILFDCGAEPADPTDGSDIQAKLDAGTAIKIAGNIKFTLPEASPITVDPVSGCSTEETINYDRTLEMVDSNVTPDNVDFYNLLLSKRFGAILFLECDALRTTFISPKGGITTQANRLFPELNTELQTFAVNFAWRSKTMPTIHTLPTPNVF
jgi:hypothetical protein